VSRYISINRLAIRKLLKKYSTASKSLKIRVDDQILNQPGSFTKFELKTVLNQYTVFLDTIRSTFDERSPSQDLDKRPPSKGRKSAGTHKDVTISLFQSTAINFDTALAVPSERCTEKAIYWVHQDNIVELRIFYCSTCDTPKPP